MLDRYCSTTSAGRSLVGRREKPIKCERDRTWPALIERQQAFSRLGHRRAVTRIDPLERQVRPVEMVFRELSIGRPFSEFELITFRCSIVFRRVQSCCSQFVASTFLDAEKLGA